VVGDSNSANNYNTQTGLSLTLNNWYRLSGTFSRNGTVNLLNYSASLVDFGNNGTVEGSTISSISGTQSVSASLYSDSTALYSGLRSTIGTGQGYLDNYTLPVPEPSSALLLLGASAAIVATRRRRV